MTKAEYYLLNKDSIKEKRKLHYQKNRLTIIKRTSIHRKLTKIGQTQGDFAGHIRRKYGLSLDDWNTMFTNQTGCCLICGTHQKDLVKKLSVDHNHTTGKVRGLLCFSCNVGLGKFKDNPNLLQKAREYLLCEY